MVGTLFGTGRHRAWHVDEEEDRAYETCVGFGGFQSNTGRFSLDKWPLIEHKHGATRLGFAVLFKFFQYAGAFPRAPQDVPLTVVDHVARQVGVPADTWTQYVWDGRTIEYHRRDIRQHLGFREATVADGETLVTWLSEQIVPTTLAPRPSQRGRGTAVS